MDECRLSKQIMEWVSVGKRKKRRLKTRRWKYEEQ